MRIKSVTVGPQAFGIDVTSKMYLDPKDEGHIGQSKITTEEIVILDTMSERSIKQTLLHEIVHLIALQRNTELTEGEVDALAYGLFEFLEDNPMFQHQFNEE